MPEEPIGDDTRIPTQESDIVDEWITSLKESLEEGTIPLSDDEMLNLEMAIMEQIDNLDNETIAQQIEYHSMVRAMAALAGDQPLAMDANQNVELWEMCAARKGFTKEWEAEQNVAFAAENTSLEADYDTSGTLSNLFKFGSGDDEAIGGFTPEELAKSSAIHGDFNQASLGYSGHQNIQLKGESVDKSPRFCCGEEMELDEVEDRDYPGMMKWIHFCPVCEESDEEAFAVEESRVCSECQIYGYWDDNPVCPMCRMKKNAESFEAPMDVFNPGRTDVENSVAAVLRSAKKDTGANWKLYTAFRPLYYIHTADQGQPSNVKGVSNKFLTFFIVKKDGANLFRAYNAWARIGYTPGKNQVFNNYEGDLSNAEAALRNKIAVKTKSRRSSGTYVLRQYAEESSTGKCACGVNCVCDCGCAESGVCNCGASCPCNCGCGVKAAEDTEEEWDEHTLILGNFTEDRYDIYLYLIGEDGSISANREWFNIEIKGKEEAEQYA